jgi:hypothetical protein
MVEPFDTAANPQFKFDKDFKARVVLINRESVLTEDTAQAFGEMASACWSRMEPETVITVALRGEMQPSPSPETARRPTGRASRRKAVPRAQQA